MTIPISVKPNEEHRFDIVGNDGTNISILGGWQPAL